VYLADEMPGFGAVKSPKTLKGTSANVHLWVEDCDAAFARAVASGAKVLMPLTDQFWGDRYGMVADPFGHVWAISSQKEELTPEEIEKRGAEAMAHMAAAPTPPRPKVKKAKKKLTRAQETPAAATAVPKAAAEDKSARKAKAGKKDKSKKSKKSKKDKKRKKKSKR
jgi:Glyoxalase-like domain